MRFLPAVGYALFTRCGSALLTRRGSALLSSITMFWTSASLPARRQSSVLDRASGFLSLASSSHVLRVVWWSPSTTPSSPRAARLESVVFSRSCNETLLSRALLSPTMALHGSPASLHANPCFDKLFARPRADPRGLIALFSRARLLWLVVVQVGLLD